MAYRPQTVTYIGEAFYKLVVEVAKTNEELNVFN